LEKTAGNKKKFDSTEFSGGYFGQFKIFVAFFVTVFILILIEIFEKIFGQNTDIVGQSERFYLGISKIIIQMNFS